MIRNIILMLLVGFTSSAFALPISATDLTDNSISISANEAIRINFEFTGQPDLDSEGFMVIYETSRHPSWPDYIPLPANIKFYASIYDGKNVLNSTPAVAISPFELFQYSFLNPNQRVFYFSSSTSTSPVPNDPNSTPINFDPIIQGTKYGSVLIWADAPYEFVTTPWSHPFELDLTKGNTFNNYPNYPFATSYEIVQFASNVPEPEVYATMLAGLGLMGFVARRRKV